MLHSSVGSEKENKQSQKCSQSFMLNSWPNLEAREKSRRCTSLYLIFGLMISRLYFYINKHCCQWLVKTTLKALFMLLVVDY